MTRSIGSALLAGLIVGCAQSSSKLAGQEHSILELTSGMEANKPIEVFFPFFMHADLRSANLAMSSLLKRHDLNDDVECLSATLSYPGNGR